MIGSDVISSMEFNYMNFKPCMDSNGEVIGCDVTQALIMKPGGSIPNMIVGKMSKAQQSILLNLTKSMLSMWFPRKGLTSTLLMTRRWRLIIQFYV